MGGAWPRGPMYPGVIPSMSGMRYPAFGMSPGKTTIHPWFNLTVFFVCLEAFRELFLLFSSCSGIVQSANPTVTCSTDGSCSAAATAGAEFENNEVGIMFL